MQDHVCFKLELRWERSFSGAHWVFLLFHRAVSLDLPHHAVLVRKRPLADVAHVGLFSSVDLCGFKVVFSGKKFAAKAAIVRLWFIVNSHVLFELVIEVVLLIAYVAFEYIFSNLFFIHWFELSFSAEIFNLLNFNFKTNWIMLEYWKAYNTSDLPNPRFGWIQRFVLGFGFGRILISKWDSGSAKS